MNVFDYIAGYASIIGLAISVWTLLVARSAHKAAVEAKEAVYQGSASDDIEDLARLAKDFLDSVHNDRTAESLVRARDLTSGIALARQRWSRFIDRPGKTTLETASLQIRVAARELAIKGPPATDTDKERLISIADGIVSSLSAEAGKLRSRQEAGKS